MSHSPAPSDRGAEHRGWTSVERRLSGLLKPRLPVFACEFIAFGLKMAWASLYAGLMLALLIGSKLVWQTDWPMARYDFLLAAAIIIQAALLLLRLETPKEALVIFIFHVVGTIMELFKTKMGPGHIPNRRSCASTAFPCSPDSSMQQWGRSWPVRSGCST